MFAMHGDLDGCKGQLMDGRKDRQIDRCVCVLRFVTTLRRKTLV